MALAEPSSAVVAPVRDASPTSPPRLQPVGPGYSESEEETPRWVRPRPLPITVRWLNALTEGKPFIFLLTMVLALGVTAAAWAVATTTQGDGVRGIVSPTATTNFLLPTEASQAAATPAASPTPAWTRRYVVRDGDTLSAIAKQVYGDETLWPLILEANRDRLSDPENLRVGTHLLIPDR